MLGDFEPKNEFIYLPLACLCKPLLKQLTKSFFFLTNESIVINHTTRQTSQNMYNMQVVMKLQERPFRAA